MTSKSPHMTPFELIMSRRLHLTRCANTNGALGEQLTLRDMQSWIKRPTGPGLRVLLQELRAVGTEIKGSSFDALFVPQLPAIDFLDIDMVRTALPSMTFIEIKTANQTRVKPGFAGFFFALTESEIRAAQVLGTRHRVALYNRLTTELQLTSVDAILERAKSSTWQLSVQL
jgi:hypothetical protein